MNFHLNWQPHISEPSILGWTIIALYLSTAFLSFYFIDYGYEMYSRDTRIDRFHLKIHIIFWKYLGIALLSVGLIRQLDIHNLLIEVGRVIVRSEGIYEIRHQYQFIFVSIIGVAALYILLHFLHLYKSYWRSHILALIGIWVLTSYVLLRAVSYHKLDYYFLRVHFNFLQLKWVIEFGSIFLIFLSILLNIRKCQSKISKDWR